MTARRTAEHSGDPSLRRVLWLIKGLGPGGAERLLVAAAIAGDRNHFVPSVAYLLPGKDHLVDELEGLGVACTCLDMTHEIDLRWALRLRRMLRAEPVDVVHLHSPYVAAVARLVVRSLPPRMRPHLVTTEHNSWATYRGPTHVVNALTAPLDDAVVAVSDEVRASLPQRRRDRSVTLAHGVATEHVRAGLDERADVRRELGIDPSTFVFATVANYQRKKDWPTFLRAARIAVDARPGLRFCAIGQGPLQFDVESLHEELHLADSVLLTGYRADAARVVAAADAFVLASHWEGLPVAIMEACVLGLPIVASAVGGIPERFTDGVDALLVPPGDPAALAVAILRVVDDQQLRSRLAAAAAAHGDGFDARDSVATLEAIYDQVLLTGRQHHLDRIATLRG